MCRFGDRRLACLHGGPWGERCILKPVSGLHFRLASVAVTQGAPCQNGSQLLLMVNGPLRLSYYSGALSGDNLQIGTQRKRVLSVLSFHSTLQGHYP